jgi:cytoskeletal protein CcmA (bactofilin family)
MSIFRRDSPDSPTPQRAVPRDGAAPQSRSAKTYIAAGSKFQGDLTGSAEVLIDGEMEGRLQISSSVTIGREGHFQGEVAAHSVRVEGKLHGNVHGKELVEVTASGSLEGDIAASRVVIAEGAFFKGNVEMGAGQTQKPKAGPAAPADGKTANESNKKGGA